MPVVSPIIVTTQNALPHFPATPTSCSGQQGIRKGHALFWPLCNIMWDGDAGSYCHHLATMWGKEWGQKPIHWGWQNAQKARIRVLDNIVEPLSLHTLDLPYLLTCRYGDDEATSWLSHFEWSPLFLVVKSTLILTSYLPFSGSWCLHLCWEDFLI